MPQVLAIDQSTSATKALLFDEACQLVDQVSEPHEQIFPQPGWVEHDAAAIWNNLKHAAGQLLSRQRAVNIGRVSITNQRETFVAFDRVTGAPVANAIVWQCRRGEPICLQVQQSGAAKLVRERTGLPVDTYFSAPKMAWLMRNNPAVAAGVRDGRVVLGTIDSYLIHRLTGGKVFATDITNACRTLLFNIHTREWDAELCEIFGIPPAALPTVLECTDAFGQTDLDGLLPSPVPVRGVMGDSQASLLANRCVRPGMTKVTLGTGASILMNVGDRVGTHPSQTAQTIAWSHGGRATYCIEGLINSATSTLNWLRDQLGILPDIASIGSTIADLTDTGGVYLVPAFAGLGTPHWSAGARAAIVGLSGHSDRRHIIRAGLEAIAYQLHDAIHSMCDPSTPMTEIRADGGATANAFLIQFIADITGLRVVAAANAQGSALGAVFAGRIGTGESGFETLPAPPAAEATYLPRMDRAEAQRLHDGWRKAVAAVIAHAGM